MDSASYVFGFVGWLVGCLVDFCPMVPADKNDPECVKCGEMLFKVKEDLFFFFFFIFFHHDHHLHVWLCKRVPHLGTLPFILVPNDGHHTHTHTHTLRSLSMFAFYFIIIILAGPSIPFSHSLLMYICDSLCLQCLQCLCANL